MKKVFFICFIFLSLNSFSQIQTLDTVSTKIDSVDAKESFGEKVNKFFGWNKDKEIEALSNTIKTQKTIIDSISIELSTKPETVVKTVKINVPVPMISEEDSKLIKKDEKFLMTLPKKYDNLNKKYIDNLAKEIDSKIVELIRQRDSLIAGGSSEELINAKNNMITSLKREKEVINLSEETVVLKDENISLAENDKLMKKYLKTLLIILIVLILAIAVILQRKRINVQDVEIENQLKDISKKNTYLEYAARLIRHDMHSGINTYIPRGISSLEKRIEPEVIETLKIAAPLKMIKEGLQHAQKVYRNVYEFTNIVKKDVALNRDIHDLKIILENHLSTTAYKKQVKIDTLPTAFVNESLFCTAVDNLIKNGLKYNDNEHKEVVIYNENDTIVIQDNGRGLTQEEFEKLSEPNAKKLDQAESGEGLGLSICKAILNEHGYSLSCEKNEIGTKMKIKYQNV